MDITLVSTFNGIVGQSPFIDGLIVFFAHDFPYLLVLLFFWFAIQKGDGPLGRLRLVIEGTAAAILARGSVELIRLFVHRPRPFVDGPITALLLETSYSFPSGHSAFFFALSTVVFLYNRKVGWWFYAGALLIGLARIAAGVHYPSDILAGAVLGIAMGYAVQKLSGHFLQKYNRILE
ncbi:MAG: phosphatase PAP2 family protein [bacterium]|nr:phosphatase PAP2 family protein [bacterium]